MAQALLNCCVHDHNEIFRVLWSEVIVSAVIQERYLFWMASN